MRRAMAHKTSRTMIRQHSKFDHAKVRHENSNPSLLDGAMLVQTMLVMLLLYPI